MLSFFSFFQVIFLFGVEQLVLWNSFDIAKAYIAILIYSTLLSELYAVAGQWRHMTLLLVKPRSGSTKVEHGGVLRAQTAYYSAEVI